MAWAVTAVEQKATYIGNLSPSETGLACDCVCPSCGGRLQAVNAGKPVDFFQVDRTTLRPHFRHHTGQQLKGCLTGMAQIAAIHLLLTEDVIFLPPPNSSWGIRGAKGGLYTGVASGESLRSRIVNRVWVDEHEARITLENGRVVLFRLKGRMGNSDNEADAVISFDIDDPEVATWSPEKILASAELVGKWMCWDRHWQDAELQQRAKEHAEEQAKENLDLLPDDFVFPEGLTPIQRSETVLHWFIKELLEKAAEIQVPAFHTQVERNMPNGRLEIRKVLLPAMRVPISNVRLENTYGKIKPDVICSAKLDRNSSTLQDLLIEVAVTHRIGEEKRQEIHRLGQACIEIDVRKLKVGGRTTTDALRAMVIDDPSNKEWIFHPHLEHQKNLANTELLQQYSLEHRVIEQMELRKKRFAGLDLQQALNEYRILARLSWEHGAKNEQMEEMEKNLALRGTASICDGIFIGKDGILSSLEKIRLSQNDPKQAYEVFKRFKEGRHHTPQYVSLVGAAISAYVFAEDDSDAKYYKLLKQEVAESLEIGDEKYARPTTYDQYIATFFPELKSWIETGKGTQKVARRTREEIQKLAEAETNALRAVELDEKKRRQKEEDKLRIERSIEQLSAEYVWNKQKGWPKTFDAALSEAFRISHLWTDSGRSDIEKIMSAAWTDRESGEVLERSVRKLHPKTEAEVRNIQVILDKGWLIHKKMN